MTKQRTYGTAHMFGLSLKPNQHSFHHLNWFEFSEEIPENERFVQCSGPSSAGMSSVIDTTSETIMLNSLSTLADYRKYSMATSSSTSNDAMVSSSAERNCSGGQPRIEQR